MKVRVINRSACALPSYSTELSAGMDVRADIPEPFARELRKCKDDAEAKEVGVEWCVQQCKELIAHGVPSLHFYTMMASDSVYRVAKEIY